MQPHEIVALVFAAVQAEFGELSERMRVEVAHVRLASSAEGPDPEDKWSVLFFDRDEQIAQLLVDEEHKIEPNLSAVFMVIRNQWFDDKRRSRKPRKNWRMDKHSRN